MNKFVLTDEAMEKLIQQLKDSGPFIKDSAQRLQEAKKIRGETLRRPFTI